MAKKMAGRILAFGYGVVAYVAFLVTLFGVQHSVMARPAFKEWWARFVPPVVERSTFVLITCGILGLICWLWQPITAVLWQVSNPAARAVILGLFFSGWGLVLYSSFLIDHFDYPTGTKA